MGKTKSTYYIVKAEAPDKSIVTYISLTNNITQVGHKIVDTETNYQRAKKKQSQIKLI